MRVRHNLAVSAKGDRRLDQSLLEVCVMRAGQAVVREDLANGRDPHVPATRRETIRGIWRAAQEGGKVAALIVMWALALDELQVDELGHEAFAKWANESPRTMYRRLAEFRAAWPEYEDPTPLAKMLLVEARRRGVRPDVSLFVPALG